MKGIACIVFILITFISLQAYAGNHREIVFLNGNIYFLHDKYKSNFPLEVLWNDSGKKPELYISPPPSKSALAGMFKSNKYNREEYLDYRAIWDIENGALYLKGIDAWQDKKRADLKTIFPKRYKNGRVKADWFTGSIDLDDYKNGLITVRIDKGNVIATYITIEQ